jgi:tRNA 2-thiouridine synthesizing protein A
MERLVDARGLRCPLPLAKARAALAGLQAGDVLTVLATDPEAPIDLAAMAADHGHRLEAVREQGHWRLTLYVRPLRTHTEGPDEPGGATS